VRVTVTLTRGTLTLTGVVELQAESLADAAATVQQTFPEAEMLRVEDPDWGADVNLPVAPCVRCGDTDPDNREGAAPLCGYCIHITQKG
jgi:hypothetical protein